MSVNGYLLKKTKVRDENEHMVIEKWIEKTPSFSLTHDMDVLEALQNYGEDNTNENLNGEITITKENWKYFLNQNTTKNNPEAIAKITEDLTNQEFCTYICF